MSTDTAVQTSLQEWIARLVRALDADPHGAGDRLRAIVGGKTARIGLDGDTVLVTMRDGELVITPEDPGAAVDGTGLTTSGTVIAILGGGLEVVDAVEQGLIDITGSVDSTIRMFAAVELLLDGASRVPRLRHLASAFVAERAAARRPDRRSRRGVPEVELLARLDLLDDPPGGAGG